MKNIVIIPARGGSKRLPGKNIKPFAGNPLIAYTIKYAKLQSEISKIVVSTDDEKIKRIALDMGVEVIDRPSEISGEHATTASALKNVLLSYAKQGIEFDTVTTLQVTNPLRPQSLFNECMALINKHPDADSVISVTRSRMKLGNIENDLFVPSNYLPGQRSQDLKAQYFENGLCYITRSALILDQEDIFGKCVLAYEVDEHFPIVDIDEQRDFDWGEFTIKNNLDTFSYLL
ncbi:MAG: acylneuraminate cytidylyltransferase family protein [Bacteroidota bacterium]